MNEKCIVINGKATVLDENINSKLLDYTDNIEEILKKENEIESIEKLKNDVEQEIKRLNDICSRNKAWCFSPFIMESIALGVNSIILNVLMDNEVNAVTDTIFGQMDFNSLLVLATGTVLTPICTGVSLKELSNRKKFKKRLNALNAMEICVDNKLNIEKENLESLKKCNNSKFENFSYVDGKEGIIKNDNLDKEFDRQKNIYYDTGYQQKKYERYLRNGNLEEKLSRYYTDDEIWEVKGLLKRLNHDNV